MGVNHLLNVSFGADITSELHPSKSLSGWDFPDVPDGCQLYRTLYAGAAWKADTGAESYNVTFDHLMSYVREHGIFGPACREELECGLGGGGVSYSIPGGFRENIYWFLGEDAFIRQCDGEERLYRYLEKNKDRLMKGDMSYLLIEALSCEQGLERLNRQFAHLDLNDYLCEYTDQSAACRSSRPTEEQLEEIFNEMGKTTAFSRRIDCSRCGYKTCEQMAVAIHNGYNCKENCIHYRKIEVVAHKGIRDAMQAGAPDESIDIILEYLGKALDGERTYVCEKNKKGNDDNTYEWCARNHAGDR